MRKAHAPAAALVMLAAAVAGPAHAGGNCARTSTGVAPLTALGAGSYRGFPGGLYPGGSDERPASHTEAGLALARLAVPRNALGVPDPVTGTSVFLSVGMSNTRNEFAQFVPLSEADPKRHPRVRAINGAVGGRDAAEISNPASQYWTEVDAILLRAGLTPAQVQMVWLKEAVARPSEPFPQHARRLQGYLESISSILKARFPNLWLVFVSSRIYAGYATTALNPEPYAYESGFSVKWLVESRLRRDVALPPGPWLSWGPYLWADGLQARGDGLTWACEDFANDGTHPNNRGSLKVAGMLLDLVHTDPVARTVYEGAGTVPGS